MVAQKSLSTHQKAFLFLRNSSFTRKRLQPFGPPFCPQKEPTGLAGGSSYAPVRLCYRQRPNRRIANLASAFLLLAARKRATRVGKAKLRTQFILFQLFLYVIPNLLFVLAYRIHVVAPAPEFTIAVFELQISKSFIQHQAAFTLQIPHKSRHTHLGWYLQQHMYMIRAAFRFENCHSFPFTKPAQYLADPTLLFPIENLPAIFGGKYHMVFAVPFCVGQTLNVTHCDLLLICCRLQLPDRKLY